MNPPIPPKLYKARLEDKIVHNEKFIQYAFELIEPYEMTFEAGQYVSIKVSDKGERRSYSICSAPNITHGFELLVDIEPGGIGSQFLTNLEFGSEIEFLGPMGVFTLDKSGKENEVVFVATGSGVTPFRSMILDMLQEKHDTRPIILYWGLRHADQLFWQDEFVQLAETFENFNFTPILSRPPEDWPLSRGRVTDILSAKEINIQSAGYYLCGSAPMIQDTKSILLEKGVPPEFIHFEKFF